MSMLGGFHLIPSPANLEEHSRTLLPRLLALRRRRAILAIVCAITTAVAVVLIAVAPLLPVVVVLLFGLIAAAVVNLCIAATSVIRLTREIRARRYEARFPPSEE